MKLGVLNCSFVVFALVTMSGCASIFNDKTQKMNVTTSSGDEVEVLIDGMPFEAPGIATVTRAKADKIVTTKNKKCTASTIMPSSVDSIFWLNIFYPGGVFGSTTDYSTEKMWKYQDSVTITCKN